MTTGATPPAATTTTGTAGLGLECLHDDGAHRVFCGDSVAEGLPCECDTLVVDAPYSEKVHTNSDPSVLVGPNSKDWHRACGRADTPTTRRPLDYAFWSFVQVAAAVAAWSPRVRGWFITITDHILAPAWVAALEAAGRYVFAPLPFFSPGSRVRLAGDGPSCWTCWIVVARPKHPPYSKWGTLPGGYVVAPETCDLVGGKPLRLMTALLRDYSRPGDLVCDPCCGAGTLGRAAADTGRRSLQIDINEAHCRIAIKRLSQQTLPGLDEPETKEAQS